MIIARTPREVPISHCANGDIVEHDGRFYMLCDKDLSAQSASLVLLAIDFDDPPLRKHEGAAIGDRVEMRCATCVIHHPKAQLVIP